MTPTIRSATAADIPQLARLRWQLYTKQGPPGESFDVYVGRFTTFATDALSGGHWPAWVAERDGSLITALWLQTVPRVPAPWARRTRPIGYLTNAFVQPDHASQGLGSRLLQTVVAQCEATAHVLVMAWPADDACPFDERQGFTRPPDPVVGRIDP